MQTKLSVALAATLAGFALSAQAANVEVYGLIDTGLNYQHVDSDRAGEDNITDMSACLFEDGVLTQVFEHLQQTDGGYHVALNAKKGTFYMLANTDGLIDLNELKGCTEEEWLKTAFPVKDGKAVDFLTGKMDLDAQTQSGIAVNSLTLKNAAQSVYLFPQAEGVKSPAGVVRKDVTVHFDEVLTTSTPGVLYVYEQENEGLEVSVEAMVDGQSKVLTKTLEEKVLKRNSIYTLTLRKDTLSSEVSLDVLAWEDGGNTQLQPDLDSQITIDKNLSSLPDGVQMTANNTVTVPSRALDFTLALDCDDELEFVSSENPCVTVEAVSSGVVGENKFVVHKALFPPGYPEEEVKVFFRRKGLNESYEEDCVKLILQENPIRLEGFTFDLQDYTCDFGRYIDNEMGRFTLPEGLELVAEFPEEDKWVKVE